MQVLTEFRRGNKMLKVGDPVPSGLSETEIAHYKRYHMIGTPPKVQREKKPSNQGPQVTKPAGPQVTKPAGPDDGVNLGAPADTSDVAAQAADTQPTDTSAA